MALLFIEKGIEIIDADQSKPTFESIFNPIEDLNVPFETGYCTIRQLALVKQRTFAKVFPKVCRYISFILMHYHGV